MIPLAAIFTILAGFFLFSLPSRWASLPLLVGACYMTLGQEIQVGPLHFTVIRILVAIGTLRVIVKKERIPGGLKTLDRVMILWGICAVFSSYFHSDFSGALVSRLALTYDSLGFYFLLRVFIRDTESILEMGKIIIILLTPIALEMIAEHFRGRNAFAVFGGIVEQCEVRGGKIRAQGPFGHSILAGTVGAVCWPLALMFWKKNRKLALLGLMVTASIVITSSSSGPIMTTIFVLFGLELWKVRKNMRLIRWGAVVAIVALDIVMKAPVYYLLARIDLTGSSTGWHRAALIESAIKHWDEWWLGGTDFTRHWMPTGVPWSVNHTDITNQYIKMGVIGGLPLMILFICVLVVAFNSVGKALRANKSAPFEHRFRIWTLGAILFGHAATWMSVSYFDQSIIFVYLVLAAIGSLPAIKKCRTPVSTTNAPRSSPKDEPNLCHHC